MKATATGLLISPSAVSAVADNGAQHMTTADRIDNLKSGFMVTVQILDCFTYSNGLNWKKFPDAWNKTRAGSSSPYTQL